MVAELQNTRPTYLHKNNLYCIPTPSSKNAAQGKQCGPCILQLLLCGKWRKVFLILIALYIFFLQINFLLRFRCFTHVVPNSKPLGIRYFVSGISISFTSECHITMHIQLIKNLNPGRYELGTTLS